MNHARKRVRAREIRLGHLKALEVGQADLKLGIEGSGFELPLEPHLKPLSHDRVDLPGSGTIGKPVQQMNCRFFRTQARFRVRKLKPCGFVQVKARTPSNTATQSEIA